MVLKWPLLLSIIITSFSASASTYENLDLKYKLQDIDGVLEDIDDIEEKLSYRRNAKLFELKALALEEKKNYAGAIKIYQKLIRSNYSKYTKYLRSKRKIRFPKRMFFYYLKTAELFVDYYVELPETYSLKSRQSVRIKIRQYLAIVKRMDQTNDMVARIHEKMRSRDEYLRSIQYENEYFIYTNIVSWQNYFKITDGTNESDVLSTVIGNCIGGGVNWSNIKYEWILQGCYFLGSSTATSENEAITYKQAEVPVTGYLAEAGWMTKSFAEDVSLGIFLDVLSQSGEWDTKDGFKLKDTDFTRFGYSLKTKWDISALSFYISLGRIFENESYIFQLQASYNF